MLIAEEGLRQRTDEGTMGWLCTACSHFMTYLGPDKTCANCRKAEGVKMLKSPARLHDETEAMKATQRLKYWQPKEFNPSSLESQMGQPMSPDGLLLILRKFIPGAICKPQFNTHLGRMLMAYYIPDHSKKNIDIVSPTENKLNLKFICCGEEKFMPEWDILPKDAEGKPQPQIRGWRSVLGIFYRLGLIPFAPDDGRRLGWYQIKESPFKRSN